MRRRAAKLLARIQADSLHYSQQATAHAARQEGAGSKPLACLLGSMQQSAQREDIAGESCFALKHDLLILPLCNDVACDPQQL